MRTRQRIMSLFSVTPLSPKFFELLLRGLFGSLTTIFLCLLSFLLGFSLATYECQPTFRFKTLTRKLSRCVHQTASVSFEKLHQLQGGLFSQFRRLRPTKRLQDSWNQSNSLLASSCQLAVIQWSAWCKSFKVVLTSSIGRGLGEITQDEQVSPLRGELDRFPLKETRSQLVMRRFHFSGASERKREQYSKAP